MLYFSASISLKSFSMAKAFIFANSNSFLESRGGGSLVHGGLPTVGERRRGGRDEPSSSMSSSINLDTFESDFYANHDRHKFEDDFDSARNIGYKQPKSPISSTETNWTTCATAVRDYDRGILRRWHRDLDTLLIFVGHSLSSWTHPNQ